MLNGPSQFVDYGVDMRPSAQGLRKPPSIGLSEFDLALELRPAIESKLERSRKQWAKFVYEGVDAMK